MRILVGYESRGGTTGRVAESIGAATRGGGHEVSVRPLAEISLPEFEGADLLVLGSWVEGLVVVGVGPARRARSWLAAIPDLGGRPVAIFCTFAINPRGSLSIMRQAVEDRGGLVVAEQAFHRTRSAGLARGFALAAVTNAAAAAGAGRGAGSGG